MKKQTLSFLFTLTTFFLIAQPCATDLFISEYGEGKTGSSKYVEIHNGTGAAVNLGDYQLWRVTNGGTWPEAEYDFTTAMLADGATLVVAHNNTDVPGADEYTSFCSWNGNDAVGLVKMGTLIDAVGEGGANPGVGWDVAGTSEATKDHILIRKATVTSPDTNWVTIAGTDPLNSQWEVMPYMTGQPATLGSHFVDCGGTTCSISISDLSSPCDPASDSFYLIINVAVQNGGASYTRTFNGMDSTVAYNTTDTIGRFLSDAAAYQIIAVDVDSTLCKDTLDGFAPAPCFVPPTDCGLVLTGVIDGPLGGGHPKAVGLYATGDIPDLSAYGIGSANNGGGSDGEEFTFPMVAVDSGDYVYAAADSSGFRDFFGFDANFISGSANINGDDAVELFCDNIVIDVFGDINTSGAGEPWEYTDSWAYRKCGTGPDASTFMLANWTFAGVGTLDGETANATADFPMPIGTYLPICPSNPCNDTLTVTSVAIDGTFEAKMLIETSGPVTVTGATVFNAPTVDLNPEFEVTSGVVFETMGTGCN